ncbi:MAG: TatD family hydrolase [Chlamydiota bacterium]|nr:TatD family hydrolase [Chlamydiota bacterium]
MIMLSDTHAHINDICFDTDRADVICRAQGSGVNIMIDVAEDLESSRRTIQNAEHYHWVYASVGLHPHHAAKASEEVFQDLETLSKHARVVALGETGLDYHYDHAPRDIQKRIFELTCKLACKLSLPVIVHSRSAEEDTLEVIAKYLPSGLRGVLHCFPGGEHFCRALLDYGFYISYSGIVTFKNAQALRDTIRLVPDDRLLVETDSPYLSPVPYRGKRNEPAFVLETAKIVAQQMGVPFDRLCDMLCRNTLSLFNKIPCL